MAFLRFCIHKNGKDGKHNVSGHGSFQCRGIKKINNQRQSNGLQNSCVCFLVHCHILTDYRDFKQTLNFFVTIPPFILKARGSLTSKYVITKPVSMLIWAPDYYKQINQVCPQDITTCASTPPDS